MSIFFSQAVQLRARAGVRTRAAYIKPAELFRYLKDIVAAQQVDLVMEKKESFARKMRKDKDKAVNAPTSEPESWEEFKQMLPQELKQTLAGQEFCRFLCNIETGAEEDTDAVKEENVEQGMVVFASSDAKERLIMSPNWLLYGSLKTFSVSFIKQVQISQILRLPLLVAYSNSFMASSISCLPPPPKEDLSPPSLFSCLTSQTLSSSNSGGL